MMFPLKKLPTILLALLLILLPQSLWGSDFTGVWESKTDQLKLTRLSVRDLGEGRYTASLMQKHPAEKIDFFNGPGEVVEGALILKMDEWGGTRRAVATFRMSGEKAVAGTWTITGSKRQTQTLHRVKTASLFAETEMFFGSRSTDLKDLPEKIRMFKAVELATTFDFQNKELGRDKKLDLGFAKVKNGTKISAVIKAKKNPKKRGDLFIEKLVLRSSEWVRVADKFRIRSVVINSKGHMKFEIKNYPDLTLTKISKKSNGDVKLHLKGFPDLTVKKDGRVKLFGFITVGRLGEFEFPAWPPSVQELMEYFANMKPRENTTDEDPLLKLTKNLGKIDYKIKAVGDPKKAIEITGVPVKTNALSLNVSGSMVSSDGRLITTGDKNKASLEIDLGNTRMRMGDSEVEAKEGYYKMSGTYRLDIPLKNSNGAKLKVYFDGDSKYALKGGKAKLILPNDSAVFVDGLNLKGTSKVTIADLKRGLTIRDGKVYATADGPIKVANLKTNNFTISDVEMRGGLVLDSNFELRDGQFTSSSSLTANGETVGMVGALKFKDRKTGNSGSTAIKPGSRIDIDMNKITTSHNLGESMKFARVTGEGNTNFNLKVDGGEASFKNFKALVKGEGELNLDSSVDFDFHRGRVHLDPVKNRHKATVNIALKSGTRLKFRKKNGEFAEIVIKGDNSSLRFNVDVALKDGRPYFDEVKNVDVFLELGDVAADLLGTSLRAPGKKTLVLTNGAIRFLPNGMDIYGSLAIRLEGREDAPTLSVRW